MDPNTLLIIVGLVSLVLTILVCALLLPKKRNGNLGGGFLQWLHDYFHFKTLYLEAILRFLFVIASIFCIIAGIAIFFYYLIEAPKYMEDIILPCLGMIVLGPIGLRLVFEVLTMGVLLVQNVLEINRKLDKKPAAPAAKPTSNPAPQPTPPVRPTYAPPTRPTYAPPAPPAPPARPTYAPPAPPARPTYVPPVQPTAVTPPTPSAPQPASQPAAEPFSGEEY